jgi:DNA invertase Pin-like site-specific DNA recombinase
MLAYQHQTHPKSVQSAGIIVEGSAPPNDEQVPAAQYVRMSTERQCYSTQNQMDAIALYARKRGMAIVRTFADEGKSGLRLDGREGLLKLVSAVQSGLANFKVILVYDVSRWGRFQDVDESGYWEYVCKRAGVMVHYCAEPFLNDGSFPSVIFKALKRTMAAEYSRELSEKVFAGHCRLIELGYRQGGPVGFGLRRMLVDHEGRTKGILDKGQTKYLQTDRVVLVPGPEEEQRIVQEIFHSFIEGSKTQSKIADDLNARGIASGTKRRWTFGLVHEILVNPKYIGANVYNRRSTKLKQRTIVNPEPLWLRKDGAFPSIVSSDLFLRAAKLIESLTHRPTDDEMLDQLRSLLKSKGKLSRKLIDRAPDMLKSRVYSYRFGSLRGAYERLGYIGSRDSSYQEVKNLKARRAECLNQVLSQLEANGASTIIDPKTGTLRINGNLTLRLILARCYKNQSGSLRWHVRQESASGCDLTLAARMNENNTGILDYYLFPKREQLRGRLILATKNSVVLDVYRFENLDQLYRIFRRKKVGGST